MTTNKITWRLPDDESKVEALLLNIVAPVAKRAVGGKRKIQVTLSEVKRSTAQNSRLWAMLEEISAQVDWYGQRLTAEEWKDVFSAAMKRTKVVPGIDGGFVVCGQSTSRMTVAEMSEMQALMEAFGAEKDVRFSAVGREE